MNDRRLPRVVSSLPRVMQLLSLFLVLASHSTARAQTAPSDTTKREYIWCLDFSPDGKCLAAGSSHGDIRLWDRDTGEVRTTFRGHQSVHLVAYSPDGKLLASTGREKDDLGIKLWDIVSGQVRAKLAPSSDSRAISLSFIDGGKTLLVGCADGVLKSWDVAAAKETTVGVTPKFGKVSAIAYAPDGKTLASSGSNGDTDIWDLTTGTQHATWRGHRDAVRILRYAPDGRTLASADRNHEVKLWDVATRKEIATLPSRSRLLDLLVFSPDGQTLATANRVDLKVTLTDTASGKTRITLSMARDENITSLAYSPDGKTIAAGSTCGTVKLWDTATGKKRRTFDGPKFAANRWAAKLADKPRATLTHAQSVNSLSLTPDGNTLAAATGTTKGPGEVLLWNLVTKQSRSIISHKYGIPCVTFDPTGNTLAISTCDLLDGLATSEVKLWDRVRDQQRDRIKSRGMVLINSVIFSPDGTALAGGGLFRDLRPAAQVSQTVFSGEVRIWETATGQERAALKGFSNAINAVAMTPDGQMIVAGGVGTGEGKWWEMESWRDLGSFLSNVRSFAFAPDGKTLAVATGSQGGILLITVIPTRNQLAFLQSDQDAAWSVAYSPDGRTVAGGNRDGSVVLWDVSTRQQLRTIKAHTGLVTSLAFTADGKTLASASLDRTVKLWDVQAQPAPLQPSGSTRPIAANPKAKPKIPERTRLLSIAEQANRFAAQANYREAARLYAQVVAAAPQVFGSDSTETAHSLRNLGELYLQMGEYSQAEPLLQQSLQMSEAKLGADDVDVVAPTVGFLAVLYAARGDDAKAEPLFQRGKAIYHKRLNFIEGTYALRYSYIVANGAAMYHVLRKDAVAQEWFRLSLVFLGYSVSMPAKFEQERLQKRPIDQRLLVARILQLQANLETDLGKYSLAEQHCKDSVQILGATLGIDHPHVALGLSRLAELTRRRGDDPAAEQIYRRVLEIQTTKLGPYHPDVIDTRCQLLDLHAAHDHWPEADEQSKMAVQSQHRYVRAVLPGLSQEEQWSFLQTYQNRCIHRAISLGLARPEDDNAIVASATAVLNGKAVALQVSAEREALHRDRGSPDVQRLIDIRQQLGLLSLQAFQTEQNREQSEKHRQLYDEEERLSKQVFRSAGSLSHTAPWVEIEEIRRVLPQNAVLLEIVKCNVSSWRSKPEKPDASPMHYVAWVIPALGREKVRIVDLGNAERLETAVRAVREAFRDQGLPATETCPRLHTLSQILLTPLHEYLDPAKHWLISPDADLWLIPWNALLLPDERYVVEDHQVSLLVTGRTLLQKTPVATGPPVVIADPDYDLDFNAPTPGASRPPDRSNDSSSRTSRASDFQSMRWNRLRGTATEADMILPKLAAFAGTQPQLYLDQQALESTLKEVKQPKVLVLSTHGFFLEDRTQDRSPVFSGLLRNATTNSAGVKFLPANNKEIPTARRAFENPLLRCGLVFAGANNWKKVTTSSSQDGILTGLEILDLDLRGTDLVVLSACDTGIGTTRNAEGVAGLRQAFELAGAKTVVATLWEIPDQSSAQLMATLFDELAQGRSKSAALRRAQLTTLRHGPGASAHPRYWAAWVLSGDPGSLETDIDGAEGGSSREGNDPVSPPSSWTRTGASICVLILGVGCSIFWYRYRNRIRTKAILV